MKRILVTAGGTAIAWHIAEVVNTFFKDQIELFVCDINDSYLVPASIIAKKIYKVPLVTDADYIVNIKKIILDNNIDIVIPLIPLEGFVLAKDSSIIKELGIISTAATLSTTSLLADKKNMYQTLRMLNIPTPVIFKMDEILDDECYLLKPRQGFGSQGIEVIIGKELKQYAENNSMENMVISEYCHDAEYDEVTVEVFNGTTDLHIFARRRIATKAGVCVKMEPVRQDIFLPYIQQLVGNLDCPKAFNVQFLYHNNMWKLFDCNLRLGAGTALSSAAGFQLTRAFLSELMDIPVKESYFTVDDDIKSVLRVYREIVIK